MYVVAVDMSVVIIISSSSFFAFCAQDHPVSGVRGLSWAKNPYRVHFRSRDGSKSTHRFGENSDAVSGRRVFLTNYGKMHQIVTDLQNRFCF